MIADASVLHRLFGQEPQNDIIDKINPPVTIYCVTYPVIL
jgi:hypothetical protein